jgi:hypothetical protein
VRLTQSNKTVAIPKGQSILSSLEHQGSSQIMVVVWVFVINVPVLKRKAQQKFIEWFSES